MKKFDVIFLDPAKEFMDLLEEKTRKKVLLNIWKSREISDPELFKKLEGEIWEFRTKFMTKHHRILAFWDKEDKRETIVVATHGFIKKTQKTPKTEIKKAEQLRKQYLENKKMKKK